MQSSLGQTPAPAGADRTRSQELFRRLAPVFQDRRCMNCHTSTDFPRQGNDGHPHAMLVKRGQDDKGAPGLPCKTCHQSANSATGVPGAKDWHLAPLRMSWEGLSPGDICRSLIDPARGGMTPGALVTHLDTDPLVLWAWSAGMDLSGNLRASPPLRHDEFIMLAEQWVATGSECPH